MSCTQILFSLTLISCCVINPINGAVITSIDWVQSNLSLPASTLTPAVAIFSNTLFVVARDDDVSGEASPTWIYSTNIDNVYNLDATEGQSSSLWNAQLWSTNPDLTYMDCTGCFYQQNNYLYISNPWMPAETILGILFIYDLSTQTPLLAEILQDEYPYLMPYQNITRSCIDSNGTHIFAAGGYDYITKTFEDKLQIYNILTETWTIGASMNNPRDLPSCAVSLHNGMFYVFSGLESKSTRLNTIDRYNPNTDEWTIIENGVTPVTLQQTLLYHSVISYDNLILIIGGMNDTLGDATNVIEVFNVSSETLITHNDHNLTYIIENYDFGAKLSLADSNNNNKDTIYAVGGENAKLSIYIGTIISNNGDIIEPTGFPTDLPTILPTMQPSAQPTTLPIATLEPTVQPTSLPTRVPIDEGGSVTSTELTEPSGQPTVFPTGIPQNNIEITMGNVDSTVVTTGGDGSGSGSGKSGKSSSNDFDLLDVDSFGVLELVVIGVILFCVLLVFCMIFGRFWLRSSSGRNDNYGNNRDGIDTQMTQMETQTGSSNININKNETITINSVKSGSVTPRTNVELEDRDGRRSEINYKVTTEGGTTSTGEENSTINNNNGENDGEVVIGEKGGQIDNDNESDSEKDEDLYRDINDVNDTKGANAHVVNSDVQTKM